MKKKMPKSLRKFIRQEKARIRREILDVKEQEKLINGLCLKILKTIKEDKSSFPPSSRLAGLSI